MGDSAQMSSQLNCEELAFIAEQRRAEMFVTVSTYKAKAGEEDAIIALHEAWQSHQQLHAKGYLSGELLRNIVDSREFIAIMRFENKEAAQALTNNPERKAWYKRVVSLTENVPSLTEYTSEWP
jgi:antibiotic biosynthesis monooxygenase (ABM) superfamily enzyme